MTAPTTTTASPADAVRAKFAPQVLGSHAYRGQETVLLRREALLDVARHLKADPALAFDFLMDLSCVDYLKFGKVASSAPRIATPSPLPYHMTPKASAEKWERGVSNDEYRFDVVYHFFSTRYRHRLRIRVPLKAADPSVESLTSLWVGANWFEREVFDMFGVTFTGHPNLKRILMYEEFKGHPLRKDYPASRRQPLIGPQV
jgi:NADH-quinone oxidoreductase subunit C